MVASSGDGEWSEPYSKVCEATMKGSSRYLEQLVWLPYEQPRSHGVGFHLTMNIQSKGKGGDKLRLPNSYSTETDQISVPA